MQRFHQIQNPQIFQGNLNSDFYFEGWYYKLVSKNNNFILAIIPGIALNKRDGTSHAFIQILNGITAKYYYLSYPVDSFKTSKRDFVVKINNNFFSSNKIHLDIDTDEISLKGTITHKNITPLPFKGISPGVMGWFAYIPKMECNHGIVSMNHTLDGELQYNKKIWDFKGGKGYIEKDWGISFPRNWIWMQSNNFQEYDRSLVVSVANIPFLGREFTGFLGVVYDRGNFYRFGTYNQSKLSIKRITSTEVVLTIQQKNLLLLVKGKKGRSDSSKTALMRAPSKGLMTSKCAESISSHFTVGLYKIQHPRYTQNTSSRLKPIFKDIGLNGGFEIMGKESDF